MKLAIVVAPWYGGRVSLPDYDVDVVTTRTFEVNGEVKLSAQAYKGNTFTGWKDDLTGSGNPAVIVMGEDKKVTAIFSGPCGGGVHPERIAGEEVVPADTEEQPEETTQPEPAVNVEPEVQEKVEPDHGPEPEVTPVEDEVEKPWYIKILKAIAQLLNSFLGDK
jgi:hypothetical protein